MGMICILTLDYALPIREWHKGTLVSKDANSFTFVLAGGEQVRCPAAETKWMPVGYSVSFFLNRGVMSGFNYGYVYQAPLGMPNYEIKLESFDNSWLHQNVQEAGMSAADAEEVMVYPPTPSTIYFSDTSQKIIPPNRKMLRLVGRV